MSRIITTILILSTCFTMGCKIDDLDSLNDIYVDIPDAHFEAILIEQGIDSDGIINQKILKTDAEQVTHLDLNLLTHSYKISDLTGIEGFVNIRLLSASNQEIERIDLSNNTLLDTVSLWGNRLSSIDLSNNANLVFLDIQANEFSSYNSISGLSNATRLKDLDLSWNYLEEFSIRNESLEVLHISHNDLKSINTNGAKSLRNILLISNKLETVDFSSNTLVETLLISGNKLQNINLDHNSRLTHLYISSNILTSLDVSNNPGLIDLRADRNPRLTCIKILNNQEISIVSISDDQKLSSSCN